MAHRGTAKMAQCNQSAQEFIQETFGPMVAVLCSHDANVVCQKNNLSFVELVQPFSRLSAEGMHCKKYYMKSILKLSVSPFAVCVKL